VVAPYFAIPERYSPKESKVRLILSVASFGYIVKCESAAPPPIAAQQLVMGGTSQAGAWAKQLIIDNGARAQLIIKTKKIVGIILLIEPM
jgi:hypothetical protein